MTRRSPDGAASGNEDDGPRHQPAAGDIGSAPGPVRTPTDHVPGDVIRYDAAGRIAAANVWSPSTLVTAGSDVVGRRPSEVMSASTSGIAEYESVLADVLATGSSASLDLEAVEPSGERRFLNVAFAVERSADGAITGAIAISHDVTELVRARHEARDRQREFRSLAEHLPDMVIRYSADGRARYANRASPTSRDATTPDTNRYLGRRPTEVDGATEGVATYEQALDTVLATGESRMVDVELVDEGGDQRIHQVRIVPERDDDDAIVGAFAIGRDVTDLVRARLDATNREYEFRTLAEHVPDVIMRYDRESRVVYANRHPTRGSSDVSDIIGRHPTEIRSAGPYIGSEGYGAALERVVATGEPATVDVEFVAPDGGRRVHSVNMVAERGPDGEIVGALAIGRNVTDLVRAQEEVADREREFRTLAMNVPDQILRFDREGRVTYVNHWQPTPHIATGSELIGRRVTELLPPGVTAADEYEAVLDRVLATGESAFVDVDVPARDGEPRINRAHIVAERDADGEIVGAVSIGQDITDLVRAEREVAVREREFRTLAENAPDLIGRWDADAHPIYMNPALMRLAATDPTGPPRVPERLTEAVQEVVRDRRPVTFEQRLADPASGRSTVHDVLLVPELGPGGELVSVLGLGRDTTELLEQREALEHAARTDSLTGLANRQELYRQLSDIIGARRRDGSLGALLLVDLDGFKHINDQYGHRLGDRILQEVATQLSERTDEQDLVVRLGGDEFVIVRSRLSSIESAAQLGRDVRDLLAGIDTVGEIRTPPLDACVGIALFPENGDHIDQLLVQADLALYEAKRGGRGRVERFRHELRAVMERNAAIEQALRACDPDVDMELHLQPICALGDQPGVTGVECLLRWRHPTMGPLEPGEFIPVAEQCGEIVPLGRWVMRRAAQIAVELNGAGDRDLQVAVNVSSRQFTLGAVVDALDEALSSTGCDPDWLTLEITESLLLDDLPVANDQLRALRDRGLSISIDDFGTGYSALQYLTRLDIDYVKIDRSFVGEIVVDRQQHEVVRTIIALADALELGVVAEGIESRTQAAHLQDLGCRLGQGFLLAEPMPLDRFLPWLEDSDDILRSALAT